VRRTRVCRERGEIARDANLRRPRFGLHPAITRRVPAARGNPWRIRRAAGQSLWNLTAPNETGRVGSSAGSARRRVAAVDGAVDALIEMTLAGCDLSDQQRYSTPNGDEDHLEAVRLGAGDAGVRLPRSPR
jgi:hypothetical protein